MKRMEICQMAHENAQRKGFWAEKMSNEHCLMLICTEIAELVEAGRTNKVSEPIERFRWLEDWYQGQQSSDNYNFHNYFKNTVEDELADSVIRLLDTAGVLGVDISNNIADGYSRVLNNKEDLIFTERIYDIISVISSVDSICVESEMSYFISDIWRLCRDLNIDLWKHVELKLKFNSLRPYKHGKNY